MGGEGAVGNEARRPRRGRVRIANGKGHVGGNAGALIAAERPEEYLPDGRFVLWDWYRSGKMAHRVLRPLGHQRGEVGVAGAGEDPSTYRGYLDGQHPKVGRSDQRVGIVENMVNLSRPGGTLAQVHLVQILE